MTGKVLFKLQPDPTFEQKVKIPLPGADSVEVGIIYRHKTREQLADYMKRAAEATIDNETGLFMEMVAGWSGVDAEFSAEAAGLLMQNYQGALPAILTEYVGALTAGRRKN